MGRGRSEAIGRGLIRGRTNPEAIDEEDPGVSYGKG
jgi:hypothetical protein